jgi:hypothetical protein
LKEACPLSSTIHRGEWRETVPLTLSRLWNEVGKSRQLEPGIGYRGGHLARLYEANNSEVMTAADSCLWKDTSMSAGGVLLFVLCPTACIPQDNYEYVRGRTTVCPVASDRYEYVCMGGPQFIILPPDRYKNIQEAAVCPTAFR